MLCKCFGNSTKVIITKTIPRGKHKFDSALPTKPLKIYLFRNFPSYPESFLHVYSSSYDLIVADKMVVLTS